MTTDVKETAVSENGCLKEENENPVEQKLDFKSSSSIKQESSGLENKSSTEILTELFSAFNAEPPVIEEVSGDGDKPVKNSKKNSVNHRSSESGEEDSAGDKVKEKKGEKKKKDKKKKHKHKSSKHRHSSKKESDSSGINRLHRSREKDKDDIATYSKIKEKILKASASNSKQTSEKSNASTNEDSIKERIDSRSDVVDAITNINKNAVDDEKNISGDTSLLISTEVNDQSTLFDHSSICLPETVTKPDGLRTEAPQGKNVQDPSSVNLLVSCSKDNVEAIEVDVIPLPEDCASQELSSSENVKPNDYSKCGVKEEIGPDTENNNILGPNRTTEHSFKSEKNMKKDGRLEVNEGESHSTERIESVNVAVSDKNEISNGQKCLKAVHEKSEYSELPGNEKSEHVSNEKCDQSGNEKTESSSKNVKSSSAVPENKTKSKIKIKNLKFSTVFQQTLKEAEEQARKKEEEKQEEEIKCSSESDNVNKKVETAEVTLAKAVTNEPQHLEVNDSENLDNSHSSSIDPKIEEQTLSVSKEEVKGDEKEKCTNNSELSSKELEALLSIKDENDDHDSAKEEQEHLMSDKEDIVEEPEKDKAEKINEASTKKRSRSRSLSKCKVKEKKKRRRSRSKSREKSKKNKKRSKSPIKAKSRSRSRRRSRSPKESRNRKRSRSVSKGKRKKRSRSGSKCKRRSRSGSKGGKRSRSKGRKKSRSRSKARKRSASKERKKSRSRSKSTKRSESKERKKGSRSRSKSRKRSRSKSHKRSRSASKGSKRSRSKSKKKSRSRSRKRSRSKSRKRSRSYSHSGRKSRSKSRRKSRSRSRKKSRSTSRRKSRSQSRKRSVSRSKRKSRSRSRRSRSRRKSTSRSRKRSRSRSRKRSHSKSQRKSRSKSRRRSASKSRRKSRSRSRRKSRSRSRRKSRSKSRRKSRSKSRRKSRSRSRRRSRSRKRSLSLIKCWRRSRSRSKKRSRERDRSKRSRSKSKTRRSRSKSRSKSKGRRSRSKGRSRSRKRSCSRKQSRSHSKKRSRSRSKKRSKSAERRSRSRSRKRSRGSGGGAHDKEKESRRSKTVEKSKLAAAGGTESTGASSITSGDGGKSGEGEEEKLDKARLLEIARKNAVNLLQQGSLPPSVVGKDQKGKLLSLKAGGKSVEELTEYCKELSRKEAMGESSESDGEGGSGCGSHVAPVIHHPFQIKERPTPGMIGIGIRSSLPPANAIMDKPSDQSKLRMQFPVSSGQEHRKTESDSPLAICYHEEAAIVEDTNSLSGDVPEEKEKIIIDPKDQVFPDYSNCEQNMDIGSIVSQRLTALRKLQENPDDVDALNEMTQAQKDMQVWAESKSQPGLFTGSTGAKVLSAAELASGSQAWARKDQLKCATPLTGGMGMLLLQKMGWRPGEGLGKNKEGVLEPLKLDVKTDKRGLVSQEELHRHTNVHRRGHIARSHSRHSFGKHPVSVLVEICSKRRWKVPHFQLVFESGPDHKKSFLFKAIVNGVEYLPPAPSPNKKQAKAHAASICLQAIGVYPPSMGYDGACV